MTRRPQLLLSRVADNLYWGARYLERAEDTARLVRAYTELVIDLPTRVTSTWEPLLAVAGSRVDFDAPDAGFTKEDVTAGLMELVRADHPIFVRLITDEELHAFIDGELDPIRAADVAASASGLRSAREAVVAAPTSGPTAKMAASRCRKSNSLNTW